MYEVLQLGLIALDVVDDPALILEDPRLLTSFLLVLLQRERSNSFEQGRQVDFLEPDFL